MQLTPLLDKQRNVLGAFEQLATPWESVAKHGNGKSDVINIMQNHDPPPPLSPP